MQRISNENYTTASLDDFHLEFFEIWKRDISERSLFDLWLHVVGHVSKVGRAVRKQHPPAVIDDIADSMVWMLSFVAFCQNHTDDKLRSLIRIDNNPSRILWNKYPNLCPGCFQREILDILKNSEGEITKTKFQLLKPSILQHIDEKLDRGKFFEPCSCLAHLQTKDADSHAASLRYELN